VEYRSPPEPSTDLEISVPDPENGFDHRPHSPAAALQVVEKISFTASGGLGSIV
jgi:hypothetical protein